MKTTKCTWAKDTVGFYITPLVGYARIGQRHQLYVGWLMWLFTVEWVRSNTKVEV